ncbi:MAG: hypothetical protein EYR95_16940 [Phormidium sp. SL48-SHIP]|nr:MAG: hypothetical protein EYR95_16940 [Phormidium sp. SL48-SHIP]
MDEQDCLRFLTLDRFLYVLPESAAESASESGKTAPPREFPPAGKLPSPLDGYIRCQEIQDSQLVQIDCSGNPSQAVKPFQDLGTLQKTVLHYSETLDNPSQGNVESSWLVWGQLMVEEQSPLELAKTICTQFNFKGTCPNWQVDLIAKGRLLGATLYELWCPPQGDGEEPGYHLLICLFDCHWQKGELQKRVGGLLKHCQFLFLYHHKVVWAFQNSRRLRESLQQPSRMVPQVTNQSLARLETSALNLTELQDHLRQSLTVLAVYGTQLNYLQEQRYTIEINLENYDKRVLKLAGLGAESGSKAPEEEVRGWQGQDGSLFLNNFSQFAREKYLRQIERDYSSLSPGLLLVENSIKAVESLNQIEQTRSDRRLNTTLTIASVGVATSAVVATVVVAEPPPNRDRLEFHVTTIIGSLLLGGLMSVLAWKLWFKKG